MPGVHRQGDSRFCGATTITTQSTVFANGRPIAREGDPSTHAGGILSAVYGSRNVYVVGALIICAVGDKASPDAWDHPAPPTDPAGASSDVIVYGGAARGGR